MLYNSTAIQLFRDLNGCEQSACDLLYIRCIFVCRFCALVRALKTTPDGNSIRARRTTDQRESQDIGHCLRNARWLYQFRRAPLLLHNCIAITFAYCIPSRITYALVPLRNERDRERVQHYHVPGSANFLIRWTVYLDISESRIRPEDSRGRKLCSALWTLFFIKSYVCSRRSFSSTKANGH